MFHAGLVNAKICRMFHAGHVNAKICRMFHAGHVNAKIRLCSMLDMLMPRFALVSKFDIYALF
jgi:hypothetical protein